jgi:FdhE protein
MPAPAGRGLLWDARIARAQALIPASPAAAEALTFYAALAGYQKSLLPQGFATATLDLDPVLDAVPGFLSWLPRVAPSRLAEAAADMGRIDRARWRRFLQSYAPGGNHDLDEADEMIRFVLEALLQPFAEATALARVAAMRQPFEAATGDAPSRCQFCDALPAVGLLREEGQGARRTLLCGLCLTEWPFFRVACPSCGEQGFDALPVYTADRFAHVRIDACERCRGYLKTIDLTKDGAAVPLVDDIATMSLDLWARKQGYSRLRSGLLGI